MKKIKLLVRTYAFYLILGFCAVIFALLYFTKQAKFTASYPSTTQLVTTQNLICEEEEISAVGARDTCYGKEVWGFTQQGKVEHLQEGMRIENSDKWIGKDYWDKRRIKIRRAGNEIYTVEERLIKELEKKDDERKFLIVNETDNKLIAYLYNDKNMISTSSATLFLDKSKGLLMYSDTSSSLFCNESLTNRTILYSCKTQ
jgi:hypothetical protein